MNILGYECSNEEKLNRAIYGAVAKNGKTEGGVGEDAPPELKLAAYDRLGGLITKDGRKVKNGCFCDYEASKSQGTLVAFEKPDPILLINDFEGNVVEFKEGDALTPEVRAAEIIAEKKRKKKLDKIAELEAKKIESREKRKEKRG